MLRRPGIFGALTILLVAPLIGCSGVSTSAHVSSSVAAKPSVTSTTPSTSAAAGPTRSGAMEPATPTPAPAPVATQAAPVAPRVTSQPAAPQQCLIKGNISSSGERIYHVPGQQNYDETVITASKGERWFCTEEDAVAAGWRRAKR